MHASGKIVVSIILVAFVTMSGIILVRMTDTQDQKEADAKIKMLIEEQYKITQKKVDELLEKKQVDIAIETWKKFIKKFSYRNQYKDKIVEEVRRLEETKRLEEE